VNFGSLGVKFKMVSNVPFRSFENKIIESCFRIIIKFAMRVYSIVI